MRSICLIRRGGGGGILPNMGYTYRYVRPHAQRVFSSAVLVINRVSVLAYFVVGSSLDVGMFLRLEEATLSS